ncbi:glycosyltransferase family 2 protein [Bradyrhizobium vignae]|uniref:glycosyltransferase family 2 protein n=1 Tax=Bradyrhizobium vignae TaxID=1549949 RepID=UPI00100B4E5F|nr:glycosyltransferase [Bradyrhizobium vignae]RXG91472.1 glycosyltransferase [Bradyrhizobium vignae]
MTGSLSVIIPCYNYGRYLRACVESVLTQEVDVDVCIIDDASADDTEIVGSSLAAEDPRVTFQRHIENRGHIATYNEGLERAQGTYSLLLSADDLLAPGALRRACDVLDARPDVVLLYGRVLEFRDIPPRVLGSDAVSINVQTGQDFIAKCCKDVWNPISTPAAVVRTSAQQDVGGYRPTLPHAGDREMWLRLATRGNVAELQGSVQAFYRLHEQNMHRQWFYDFLVNERELRNAYETFFRHSCALINESDKLQRLCAQRLAERGIWWAYQNMRRMKVLSAVECLKFAASVWHDKQEDEVNLLNVQELLAPFNYALGERERRRLAKRLAALPSSSGMRIDVSPDRERSIS